MKFSFPDENFTLVNISDLTFISTASISFTKGGYHGVLPDYGYLIAESLNSEFLKKMFDNYVVPTLKIGEDLLHLNGFHYDQAKECLLRIKQIVADQELLVINSAEQLREKKDSSLLGSGDVEQEINQLGDLRIVDFIQLSLKTAENIT